MFPRTDDLLRVLPELIWCVFGMLAMLLQPFVRSAAFFYRTGAGRRGWRDGAAFVAGATPGEGFYGLIQSDVFSFFFRLLIGLVAVLVVLAADSYLERENLPFAEFYALVLFATAGMGVLASARELLTAFIGLELSSISSYILAGFRRDSMKSSEASLKYFLAGIFCHGIFPLRHCAGLWSDGHDQPGAAWTTPIRAATC